MKARIVCHPDATKALGYVVGDSITPDTELDERHLISWGNLPAPPPDEPWLGEDLLRALDEPVQRYRQLHNGPVPNRLWRCSIGLHPDDGGLNDAQWDAVAHHVLRAAGIAESLAETPFRWAALRDGGRALHVVATLVREPDHSTLITPDFRARTAVTRECNRLTHRFRLTHTGPHPPDRTVHRPPTAVSLAADAESDTQRAAMIAQVGEPAGLADLITQVTDEQSGPLAELRRFAESAAHWSTDRSEADVQDAGHRLEWVARRLHSLQHDLAGIGAELRDVQVTPASRARPGVPGPAAPLKYMPRPRTR